MLPWHPTRRARLTHKRGVAVVQLLLQLVVAVDDQGGQRAAQGLHHARPRVPAPGSSGGQARQQWLVSARARAGRQVQRQRRPPATAALAAARGPHEVRTAGRCCMTLGSGCRWRRTGRRLLNSRAGQHRIVQVRGESAGWIALPRGWRPAAAGEGASAQAHTALRAVDRRGAHMRGLPPAARHPGRWPPAGPSPRQTRCSGLHRRWVVDSG